MGGLGLSIRRRAIQSSLTRQNIAVMNWIEFNKQIIELNYHVNPNTEINISCRLIKNSNSNSNSANNRILFTEQGEYQLLINQNGIGNNFDNIFVWTPKSFASGAQEKSITINGLGDKSIFNMGFRKDGGNYLFYVDNDTLRTNGSPLITFDQPLYIGGAPNLIYNRSNLRLYGIQIYELGTQVRNYVPVDIDGKTGLYDTITRGFVTSTDGSNFITG